MIPIDAQRYISKVFATPEQADALEVLAAAVTHDGVAAGPRLLRCAIIASNGNLAELRHQVEELTYDYRNVILAAEYVHKNGQWLQLRDLSQPIDQDA